ncbi:MAG: sigma 54-interacting transcriptional regulator [Deltaproteobacteria bacterium]|nr:sigma 54-interacting transcriptional regulator [Deltaproteobacteria bacterium]
MNEADRRGLDSPSLNGPVCIGRADVTPCCVILESINDGVFIVGPDRRITSFFNRAAEEITGFSSEEAMGRYCFDVFRSDLCQTRCPLELTMNTGQAVYDQPCTIINKAGEEVAVSTTTAPIRNGEGEVVGAVEIFRDLSLVEALRKALSARYRLGDLVSKSPRMQEIFEILPDVAESDSTVLIQGPSGSGKEVLATAIHDLSLRKGNPFVKVNCGAIPDTLLESELFGYVRGAFTDARRDKPGRFSLANHGTLFLDEVADMSPALQVKLLRVLEEKRFIPLGGTTPVKADVRIIAASNRDIERRVKEGRFREDLYYRLNIIKIELPPLCERSEDIPLLVENFISKLNSLKRKCVSGVSHEVMDLLMNYPFPGNVRELENILEHAFVLCRGPFIEKRDLPCDLLEKAVSSRKTWERGPLACSEAQTIEQILEKHGGNRILAARELGMSRSTLWRKMKRFHLQ